MSTLDKVKEEVHFWLRNINAVNRYHIKQNHVLTKVVYSDANKQGYGDYMVQKMGEQIARGNFTKAEIGTSSTCRELLAVKHVINSLAKQLQHESVLWYSDNWNVSKILEVGSPKEHLQDLALQIFDLRIKLDLIIIPCWVPRGETSSTMLYLSTETQTIVP